MPSSSDQTRVGRTLTLGGGAESSLEGSDIELSVSPKDIRTSPYDLCANRSDRRQSREGADGSNPLPSTGESGANLIFRGRIPSMTELDALAPTARKFPVEMR